MEFSHMQRHPTTQSSTSKSGRPSHAPVSGAANYPRHPHRQAEGTQSSIHPSIRPFIHSRCKHPKKYELTHTDIPCGWIGWGWVVRSIACGPGHAVCVSAGRPCHVHLCLPPSHFGSSAPPISVGLSVSPLPRSPSIHRSICPSICPSVHGLPLHQETKKSVYTHSKHSCLFRWAGNSGLSCASIGR